MLTAIIVAAGSSRRMGFDKMLAPLAGRPVIEHAVDAFENAGSVTEILVVTREDRVKEFGQLLGGKSKVRKVVAGGEHRQNSVKAGLEQLDEGTQYVAVHDAARPLVTVDQIERTFVQARVHGAASLAEAVSDTLKRAKDLTVTESVSRHDLFAMQTPQIFARALLEEAYRAVFAQQSHITDEVSAIEQLGRKVVLVPADDFNFKVTYERDLQLAEFVLRGRARQ